MTPIDERLQNAFDLYAPANGAAGTLYSRGRRFDFGGCGKLSISSEEVSRSYQTYIVFPSSRNPRWIFPNDKKYILNAGNLVKPSTFLSRAAWSLFRLCVWTGFPLSYAFPTLRIRLNESVDASSEGKKFNFISFLQSIFDNKEINFILYTGVKGPFQKYTAQIMNASGEILFYAKLSRETLGKYKIRKEAQNLKLLQTYSFTSLQHPTLLSVSKYNTYKFILQSKPDKDFKTCFDLTEIHQKSLAELFAVTARTEHTLSLLLAAAVRRLINDTTNPLLAKSFRTITVAIENILSRNPDILVPVGFSHGDFTPWNALVNDSSLFLYDWELGDFRTPYWDILNYISHTELLLKTGDANNILEKMKVLDGTLKVYTDSINKFCVLPFALYLKLFLVEIAIYYHNYIHDKLRYKISVHDNAEHYLTIFSAMLDIVKEN